MQPLSLTLSTRYFQGCQLIKNTIYWRSENFYMIE